MPCQAFLPISDGEKDAVIDSQSPALQKGSGAKASPFSPVTIPGEGAGRRMRGSAKQERLAHQA
ncbi:hypothetical protein MES4922_60160 [Mesorhizobium ventifaucium]|uniref:Propionyl-coenzyme A carboxylase alpha polypeptide n=1 Tax=Mesorhizobium ventifaucium TaxID=666020 RepID=A0ABM9ED50_9HYPH|nr:hypothetical protein MES4922_60160 [Mesorhizobium ventifaucium]